MTLHDISRRFGSTIALDGVSLAVRPGSVHGVLGENGAGKTTLLRIAAGLMRPDRGTVAVDGKGLRPGVPADATDAGVAMVHQHFMLVPTLTVAENCVLGRRDLGRLVSRRAVGGRIADLAGRLGFDVDPHARVETLSVGQQQRVEIVRALDVARRVLILDEPTAVLAPAEIEPLFAAIDRLRRDGLGIVFISHKLDEVKRICDELTILRRGRVVYHGDASLSTSQMAEHMVGSAISPIPRHEPHESAGTIVLRLEGVDASDPDSHRRIAGVSLSVRAGEFVGIAGVEGNGQDVLAAAIVGLIRVRTGKIELEGRDITRESVRGRASAGVAHVAEDRLRQALVADMTLRENLILKSHRRFARHGLIRWNRVERYAQDRLRRFDVRAAGPAELARNLSGGNQQKLVLARELDGAPKLIVAHNPVRGLDVAATRFVFDQLLAQRERGAGVLLIHSDLDELLGVADRVAVMVGGRCRMTDWPRCERAAVGRLMLGGTA